MKHWRQGRVLRARFKDALRALRPAPITADARERLRVVLGAAIGILLTAWLSHQLAGAHPASWPWIVAPMGASAVLVFAVPNSPLAQPWAVVGGNVVSTLVGVLCVRWFGPSDEVAGLAVGAAIATMFALRCLHPPGGASALLVVMAGQADPLFAFNPVLANTLLLVLAGVAYNRATGRNYPHRQVAASAKARDAEAAAIDADLDAVLARHNQVLDISRADLKALLEETRLSGYQRKLSNLRCGDIMSRHPVTVGLRTPLQQAWALFRQHRIKALPVVDAANHVIGIVTQADFMRAAEGDGGESADARLRAMRGWAGGEAMTKQQVVGEIMSRQVRVASLNRYLAELIPLFSSTGHHHIPIIDGNDLLVGIVTQSDVVAALSKTDEAVVR